MNLIVTIIGVALALIRLHVPTVGHSWVMVFIAVAHMFVGGMIVLLWQRRGRWGVGWVALLLPSLTEAILFVVAAP